MSILEQANVRVNFSVQGLDTLNRGGRAFNQLSGELQRAEQRMQSLSLRVKEFGYSMLRVSAAFGGAAFALGGMITVAARASIQLDETMSKLQQKARLTDNEISQLTDDFREMSILLPNTARDLAEAGVVMAQFGIHAPQAIKNTALETAKLARVSGRVTEEAAAIMFARTAVLFNEIDQQTMEHSNRIGSVLVELARHTTAHEEEIYKMISAYGGLASKINMTMHESAAFAAAMKDAGIRTEVGGTAMLKLMNRMLERAGEFAKIMGHRTAGEFASALQADASGTITKFLQILNKMSARQAMVLLNELQLSGRRTGGVLINLSKDINKLNRDMAIAEKAWKDGTALMEAYEIRMQSTQAKLQTFTGAVETLAASIGDTLKPSFNFLLDVSTRITQVLNEMPPSMKFLVAVSAVVSTGILAIGAAFTLIGGMATIFIGSLIMMASQLGYVTAEGSALGAVVRMLATGFKKTVESGKAIVDYFKRGWESAQKYGFSIRNLTKDIKNLYKQASTPPPQPPPESYVKAQMQANAAFKAMEKQSLGFGSMMLDPERPYTLDPVSLTQKRNLAMQPIAEDDWMKMYHNRLRTPITPGNKFMLATSAAKKTRARVNEALYMDTIMSNVKKGVSGGMSNGLSEGVSQGLNSSAVKTSTKGFFSNFRSGISNAIGGVNLKGGKAGGFFRNFTSGLQKGFSKTMGSAGMLGMMIPGGAGQLLSFLPMIMEMLPAIGGALGPIAGFLLAFKVLTPTIQGIMKGLEPLIEAFKEFLDIVSGIVTEALKPLVGIMSTLGKGLGSIFAMLGKIIPITSKLTLLPLRILLRVLEFIVEPMMAYFEDFAKYFDLYMGPSLKELGVAFEQLGDAIMSIFGDTKEEQIKQFRLFAKQSAQAMKALIPIIVQFANIISKLATGVRVLSQNVQASPLLAILVPGLGGAIGPGTGKTGTQAAGSQYYYRDGERYTRPGYYDTAGKFHEYSGEGMATGGVVTKPVLTMIGEAGPEAVVPLNDRRGIATIEEAINKRVDKSSSTAIQGANINLTIDANLQVNMDGDVIARKLQKISVRKRISQGELVRPWERG